MDCQRMGSTLLMNPTLCVLENDYVALLGSSFHVQSFHLPWMDDGDPSQQAKEMATHTPSPCPGPVVFRTSTCHSPLPVLHSSWRTVPLGGACPSAPFFTIPVRPTLRFKRLLLSIAAYQAVERMLRWSVLTLDTFRSAKVSIGRLPAVLQRRRSVCAASILTWK